MALVVEFATRRASTAFAAGTRRGAGVVGAVRMAGVSAKRRKQLEAHLQLSIGGQPARFAPEDVGTLIVHELKTYELPEELSTASLA